MKFKFSKEWCEQSAKIEEGDCTAISPEFFAAAEREVEDAHRDGRKLSLRDACEIVALRAIEESAKS